MLLRYCLLDIETVAAVDCRKWIGPLIPPANYSKQDTIDQWKLDETERRVQFAPLDPELCKIVCVGLQRWNEDEPEPWIIANESEECDSLKNVWYWITQTCPMVGYGVSFF